MPIRVEQTDKDSATVDKDIFIPTGEPASVADVALMIADGVIPAENVHGFLDALVPECTPSPEVVQAAVAFNEPELTERQAEVKAENLLAPVDFDVVTTSDIPADAVSFEQSETLWRLRMDEA